MTKWRYTATYLLAMSVLLNLFLVALFLKSGKVCETCFESKMTCSNWEHLRKMNFYQLSSLLSSDRQVGRDLMEKDLVLSYLVSEREFDLPRALIGVSPFFQVEVVDIELDDGELKTVSLITGLSEEQHAAVVEFARIEKCPFTTKGLFDQLKKETSSLDRSLQETFFLTPEFLSIEALFNRSGKSIEKREVLSLLLEGSWEQLEHVLERERDAAVSVEERRLSLLKLYVSSGSETATEILLKVDPEYAVGQVDSQTHHMILSLLNQKAMESGSFCQRLIESSKDETIRKKAAAKLYQVNGEEAPAQIDEFAALSHFTSRRGSSPVKIGTTPPRREVKSDEVVHVIQKGETLWGISKRYGVSVATIKSHNRLKNNLLRSGKKLRIPPSAI